MPDHHEASTEHAVIQEIAEPLGSLPDDPVAITAEVEFPVVLRGYDRIAVDAYVKRTSQLVAELHATHSPEAAVRRALERIGEQVSGVLQRAHDAAEKITERSRTEAEDRLERARAEAITISADAERRVKELDAETEAIWAERRRIVGDVRSLATSLSDLAESALARFPAEEPVSDDQPTVAHRFDEGVEPGDHARREPFDADEEPLDPEPDAAGPDAASSAGG